MKLVPLLYRPRVAKGVDWGVDRIVLARVHCKEIWWCKGHRVWSGNGCPWRYQAAQMEFVVDPDASFPRCVDLDADIVRRTAKFFRDNATAINEFFECDVAHLLGAAHSVINSTWLPLDLKEVK